MKEERIKLKAEGANISTESGRYICSISMTQRAVDLLDDCDWERGKESWLNWRERSAKEREDEQQKRFKMADEIVDAYNEKYFSK